MSMKNLHDDNIYTALHVGERIQELCIERNISINHLATICNIPPSTIKNIIYGDSKNVGIVTINKICQGLNVPLANFFDMKE